jgi:hypothetical protein
MVPAGVIESALSDAAVRLYAYLWRKGAGDGAAHPSYATMAGDLGWSREKAKRAAGELTAAALLTANTRPGGRVDGGQTSNEYLLEWSSPLVPAVTYERRTPRVMGDPGVMEDPGPRVIADPPPGSPVTPKEDSSRKTPTRKTPPRLSGNAPVRATSNPGGEELDPKLEPLVAACAERGLRVAWRLTADEQAALIAKVETVGVAPLASFAVGTADRVKVGHARYFMAGWLSLRVPARRAHAAAAAAPTPASADAVAAAIGEVRSTLRGAR